MVLTRGMDYNRVEILTPFVTPTKITDPVTLPTGDGRGVVFSPNGKFMAVAHTTTPFVTIYIRNGAVFTKLANPATLPTGTGIGVSFSPNGKFMAGPETQATNLVDVGSPPQPRSCEADPDPDLQWAASGHL